MKKLIRKLNSNILGLVKSGTKVDTDLCATWSNELLRNNGYLIYGNAWSLGNVDPIFNGFDDLSKPEIYDLKLISEYNHNASDNVYKNFNSNSLDISKPYVVNMYYNESPALKQAYEEGKNVTGTHTGILTYDPNLKKWIVTHNIHGTIYQDPFIKLQSGKRKYGVTAIYSPRKNNIVNKIRGVIGLKSGNKLIPRQK